MHREWLKTVSSIFRTSIKQRCNHSNPICDIINHVLKTGIFRDDWKKANYILFFFLLSPMKEYSSNDRSISILPARSCTPSC